MDCTERSAYDEEDRIKRGRLFSTMTIDSGIDMLQSFDDTENKDEEIQDEVLSTDHYAKDSHLIIKIHDSSITAKKMVLWKNFGFFRAILASTAVIDDDNFTILTLNEVNSDDLQYILSFFDENSREIEGNKLIVLSVYHHYFHNYYHS